MSSQPKIPDAQAMEPTAHYTNVAPAIGLGVRHHYVGLPLDRVDGEPKVTGKAAFCAELDLPGLAYAALVCSTIARGRVVAVDGSAAAAVPGVIALLWHENMPRLVRPEPGMQAGGQGFALSDLPILQDDAVRWNGQPVAVVIADTLEDAARAASLVRVDYDPVARPVLSFADEKPNAVVPDSVLGEPAELAFGDAAAALEHAAALVDHVYRTPRYNHNAIEPHATVASWQDGALTVYDTTQSVFRSKQALAQVFGSMPAKCA